MAYGAVYKAQQRRISDLECVLSVLFDHYLSAYDQNDGDAEAGIRDALGTEIEFLVPNWRERRDEWQPKRAPFGFLNTTNT